jgi:hypothetical protein
MTGQCQKRPLGRSATAPMSGSGRPDTTGHTNQRGDRIRRGAVGSSDNHCERPVTRKREPEDRVELLHLERRLSQARSMRTDPPRRGG